MLRHLALAVFSFAIVGIAVFPYWVAVERLNREQAARMSAPLQISMQCPVAETRPQVEMHAAANPERVERPESPATP